MRTVVPDFSFLRPQTAADAVKLKAEDTKRKFFAGGTDLMVEAEAGMLQKAEFIDINHLASLRCIEDAHSHIFVGALTTYRDLMTSELVAEELPLLRRAAQDTAAPAIQNRGTIGGNVANGSPAADLPPAMLVYSCRVVLLSSEGEREVNYSDYHTDYKKSLSRPNELIKGFRFRKGQKYHHQEYRKVGTRKMQAISKVVFAAGGRSFDGYLENVKLAFGSVGPVPMRCLKTEEWATSHAAKDLSYEKCCEFVAQDISPIDDIRSTETYRRSVAANLVWRFLSDLSEQK